MMSPAHIIQALAQWAREPISGENLMLMTRAGAAAKEMETSSIRHWIVVGRIPYDDEDTLKHIVTEGDQDPVNAYAAELWQEAAGEGNKSELPENWRETDGNDGDAWIVITGKVEILGPPLSEVPASKSTSPIPPQ